MSCFAVSITSGIRVLNNESEEWANLDAAEVVEVMRLCNLALEHGPAGSLCDAEGQPVGRSMRRSRRIQSLQPNTVALLDAIAFNKVKKRPVVSHRITEYCVFQSPDDLLDHWRLTGPQFLRDFELCYRRVFWRCTA